MTDYFQQGVTQTSSLVNITDFYLAQILPDIQSANGGCSENDFLW